MEKYNQKLPIKIEQKLDSYIERIKAIKWFKPEPNLSKKKIETQIKLVLECFGVKAKIEYRKLETHKDWDAARDAAWAAAWGAARDAARDAAWDAARDAAWDAARDAAWDAAWAAAWGAARDAAWGAAWGATDLLALELKPYKKKYPKGNFINLIPLWELGLYPVGVMDGKFIIYLPPVNIDFPKIK